MSKVDKDIKFLESQKEKHHYAVMPIISNFDVVKRNIFLTFATISATIGAFSFLIFGSSSLKDKNALIVGDFLLLLTIIISMILYIIQTEKDHVETLKSYSRVQERFGNIINGYLEVIKGKVALIDFYKIQKKEAEERLKEDSTDIKPNYFWQFIVLILFIFSLLFICLSLDLNPNDLH